MKKYSDLLIIITSIILLIFIFINKALISHTVLLSFHIWFNTLVPSLLPMFILSDILINYHFIDYIPEKIIKAISKIFNISKSAVLVLLLSLISGFPSNARNIKTAYDMNYLTKDESEHLLFFNHFANPLFVLTTVGVFFLNNKLYGIIILGSHILGNVIIGILFRNKNNPTKSNSITKNSQSQNFGSILSKSIKKTIDSLLMISVTVTIFLIISTLISNIFNLNSYVSVFVKSILEITMGLSELAKLNISDIWKVVLSTMIISFVGLSIHLQVITSLDEKIKYRKYFVGRIYHLLISGAISYIIMKII